MNQKFVFKKPNFGPPPKGYVAGMGRGATGFVTRGDLGPAQIAANNIKPSQNEKQEQGAYEPPQAKYDQWSGYKGALFSKNTLDEQDRLAEQAYDFCERKMDERKAKQRQERIKTQLEKYKSQNIPISEKFKDLKRELSKVSVEEWESIPEAHDSSIKKKVRQKYTPVPDSVMVNFFTANNSNAVVEDDSNKDYRQAKQTFLKSKLDNVEHKQATVDRVGYLTQLNTSKMDPQMLGDLSKARLLLKSAMQSNPRNPDIWVSAARVEQLDGKLNNAREILQKGVSTCPLNQDLWLEYSRLQKFDNAKNVLIEGLRHIPKSQKLWIQASKLERDDKEMKSKILRKGLENNPSSVRLWKELIQIESLEEAKQLLYKAVEFIPKEIQLWIALSKIQNYDNAKKVLNMARKANPLNQAIWIHAAKLQQTKMIAQQGEQAIRKQKNRQKIEAILVKARDVLKKNGKAVTRDEWLDQAFYCEKSQSYLTCQAIVKISLSYELNEEQILNTLLKDAKIFEQEKGSVHTVRFLYRHGLQMLKDILLFERYIKFQQRVEWKHKQDQKDQNNQNNIQKEQQLSTKPLTIKSQLIRALDLGTKLFPQQSRFWILIIEKYINKQDYQMAETIIKVAQKCTEHSQQIKLQRVKIFKKKNMISEARCQLEILCQMYTKGQAKIQFVKLEYENGQYQKAWNLCENFYKEIHVKELWILAFKILMKLQKSSEARALIQKSTALFPNATEIWKIWIQLQVSYQNLGRARSVLDKALLKNPKDQQLHIIAFQMQYKFGTLKDSMFLLSKALKVCPKSALIWSKVLQIEPIATRKKKASIAIENCGASSAILNCSIAKIFWKENKIDKAKKWISSSLQLDRQNGDIWALYLLLLKQNYSMEYSILKNQFLNIEIKSGRKWFEQVQFFNGTTTSSTSYSKQEILQKVTSLIQQEMLRIQ